MAPRSELKPVSQPSSSGSSGEPTSIQTPATPVTSAQAPPAVAPGSAPAPMAPGPAPTAVAPSKRATTPLGSASSQSQKDTADTVEAAKARLERINLRRRRQRRHKWSRRVGGCCRLSLIVILGISVLLFVISSTALVFELAIKEDSTWKLQTIPLSYNFENFAVSSNSETCNEIGRTLYVEGHSIFGVAAGMVRCLAIAEPHQSGIHAFDVALFLEMGINEVCQQTAKHTRLPSVKSSNVSENSTNSEEDSLEEDTYDYSLEGAYEALLSKMSDTERKTLELKFNRFRKNYPISSNYATFLRVIGCEQMLRDEYSNTVDKAYRHATYSEGDIMEAPPWQSLDDHAPSSHDHKDVADPESENVDEVAPSGAVPVVVPEGKQPMHSMATVPRTNDNKITGGNNATQLLDDSRTERITWLDIPTLELNTKHSACRSIYGRNPNVLIDLFSTTGPMQNYSVIIEPVPIDWTFLRPVRAFFWNLHGVLQRLYNKRHHIFLRSRRSTGIRRRREFPYSGNFFTILDRRRQQAIAYSGTARTSLGNVGNCDTAEISLRPLIVFNDEIKLVMAGSGGEITESFEVPRMVQTLLLYLAHSEPVDTALTIPLFFPYSRKYTYHTDGLPWTFLKKWHRPALSADRRVRKLGKPGPLSKRDTISAIEVRNGSIPIFFNRDETFIVINGV
ncbi:hypothetical protein Y032_0098g3095 [Ancylostoma ceylanicum]|nr:hypothetical protein Y032_0098g3095 [Ancylostoma ceylanicum]